MEWVPLTTALGARVAAEELERRGLDPKPLFERVGLDLALIAGDNASVPYDKSAALLELAAAEARDEFFGLENGGKTDPRDLGVLSYLVLASETLEDALANLQRYLRLISQVDKLDLTIEKDRLFVTAIPAHPAIRQSRQETESGTAFFVRLCQQLAGSDVVPLEVRFTHGYGGDATRYLRFFGCPVRFDQKRNQVLFRRSDLSARVQTADGRLYRILKAHCDELLERDADYAPDFIVKLQRYVMEALPKQKAKAPLAAAHMGLSTRTMTRRLQEEGTSFAELRDAARRELARKYLTGSNQSLAQIAYLLDYSSQSAFSASFKRMTGCTPREVRKAG